MDLFAGAPVDTAIAGVRYQARFLPAEEADRIMRLAVRDLPWEQKPVVIAGRSVLQPRLVCLLGEPGLQYTYSGLSQTTAAMPSYLEALMKRIGAEAGERFNSALANYYRDGQDSMGLHRDAEPELGSDPVIASLSLGATRTFIFKSIAGGPRVKLDLGHGSLLIMGRGVQAQWFHGIDKQPGAGPRVNFTFRRVLRLNHPR